MRKALLVGSSYSSAPILSILRERGFQISVCGVHRDDPCHEYADKSYYIDYSNSEALKQLIDAEQFDFIVPSCNDTAYMSTVQATQQNPYPGFDTLPTARILHTKNSFREFTKDNAIPAPRWLKASAQKDYSSLTLPLLVKPVDAFSGRGITKITDYSSLGPAIENARLSSKDDGVIVEEFVEGSLHSHSAFVVNEKIMIDFFVDEYCSIYPYQVDCSNHPSFLSQHIRNSVRAAIGTIISKLKICDGLIHSQFIVNDDQIWIIECMRRAPGDLFGNLISYSTGHDYTELYTLPFIGGKIKANSSSERYRLIGRHTISVVKPKTLFSFSQSLPSPKVSIVPLKRSGHPITDAPYDKVAILFAEFEAAETLKSITPSMADYMSIKTIEDNHAF
ncbi:MAG: ATP-grasp domain-containing protein [Pseudomonadota bacterium]|nr:carbamoyl-phosphate synthase small subunit [Pseudomonadales bacterium]MAR90863.1 carbamoyl-phosphate synthase small subunit [Pseudomonadales bacterium]MDY6922234.1 ATP-grasp domain-containing protein [Pseudomonadota bacterium]